MASGVDKKCLVYLNGSLLQLVSSGSGLPVLWVTESGRTAAFGETVRIIRQQRAHRNLAIEVISPNNLAEDTLKKVSQFLAAGAKAVWVVYPGLRVVEVYKQNGRLGAAFSLPLTSVFNEDPYL